MDDWKKLRHCMRYLESTRYMKRHLSADNLTNLMWWVDGSYGVHWDSKGHTGAMMSIGKGAIVNVSRRHKLNVGSSIESELVSMYCRCVGSDDMVQVLHGGAGLHY